MAEKDIERVDGEVVEEPTASSEIIEFKILEPTADTLVKEIVWNKEELCEAIKAKMEVYKNNKYTDIKLAKADRAQLNKVIKAIEDRRKEIKKAFTEPYTKFENEVKGILALIKEPVELIDKQVKEHEQKQKAQKKRELQACFMQKAKDLGAFVTFEDVFEERYLNVSVTLAGAWNDIQHKLDHIREELRVIEHEGGDYAVSMKSVYLKTHDITKAFDEKKRLEAIEAAEKEAEEKARAEEARKEAEEKARKQAEFDKAVNPPEHGVATDEIKRDDNECIEEGIQEAEPDRKQEGQAVHEVLPNVISESGAETEEAGQAERSDMGHDMAVEEKTMTACFKATATLEKLKMLAEFMRDHGIAFESIPGKAGTAAA